MEQNQYRDGGFVYSQTHSVCFQDLAKKLPAIEFKRFYGTDEHCAESLYRIQWPGDFSCVHCQHTAHRLVKSRLGVECRKCHRQFSLTKGTPLAHSNVPLVKWFQLFYTCSRSRWPHLKCPGLWEKQQALKLGVDLKTLRRMLKTFQEHQAFWSKLQASYDHLEWLPSKTLSNAGSKMNPSAKRKKTDSKRDPELTGANDEMDDMEADDYDDESWEEFEIER